MEAVKLLDTGEREEIKQVESSSVVECMPSMCKGLSSISRQGRMEMRGG